MDPDLGFYYYTSSHHRFYEGNMPEFSEKPKTQRKPKRAPRRELIGTAGRRISLPVRGRLSTRAEFHNVSIDLPPPFNINTPSRIISEHAYASTGQVNQTF